LTIVAGANGAGKSTVTRWTTEAFQDHPVLDPDAMAKTIQVTGIRGGSAIDAGRAVLRSTEAFLQKQESFLVESTLSGHTYIRMMRRAASLGYRLRLIYVGTESVEINIQRVKDRVVKGGHNVPEADQRRRFPRTLANLPTAVELADEAILFDNTSPEGPRKIALKDANGLTFYPPTPEWAKHL
jgi:predicted ABC-type ATPase